MFVSVFWGGGLVIGKVLFGGGWKGEVDGRGIGPGEDGGVAPGPDCCFGVERGRDVCC